MAMDKSSTFNPPMRDRKPIALVVQRGQDDFDWLNLFRTPALTAVTLALEPTCTVSQLP